LADVEHAYFQLPAREIGREGMCCDKKRECREHGRGSPLGRGNRMRRLFPCGPAGTLGGNGASRRSHRN